MSAALSGRVRGDRAFRLAPAFYLAALTAMPAAPALLVGAVALAVSPRGLVGSWTGRASFAPAFAAVATALLAVLVPPPARAASWPAVAHLAALYLVLQGVALAIGTLERGGRPDAGVHRAFAHAVTREAVSVPVAWLLVLLATTPGLPRGAVPLAHLNLEYAGPMRLGLPQPALAHLPAALLLTFDLFQVLIVQTLLLLVVARHNTRKHRAHVILLRVPRQQPVGHRLRQPFPRDHHQHPVQGKQDDKEDHDQRRRRRKLAPALLACA